jgi:hypothetical protein
MGNPLFSSELPEGIVIGDFMSGAKILSIIIKSYQIG